MAHDLLRECLVDGDPEQRRRERKIRRRALAISITLQAVTLAVILLVPLFGKPAVITLANVTPVPPYYSRPKPPHVTITQVIHQQRTPPKGFFAPTRIPQHINTDPQPPQPVDESVPVVDGVGIDVPNAIPMVDTRASMPPPAPPQPKTPKVVHLSQIDASKLVYRVEPIYPVLMKQIGKSGKVDLHAIIGEDGMIQSLEAVGGDPMFFASAMQAVKQWRYTPTMLNGQAVKVDTYVTVIYNLSR
jgi:periplasmic protein TonB